MLPHVLLLAVDLLLAGMQKRWALYLSMVLFGLAPYAYGLAAVSVPFILLPAAVFLAARRKVKPLDLVICVAVFALLVPRAALPDAGQDDHAALCRVEARG